MNIKTKRHKHYLSKEEFDKIFELINSKDIESVILGFQLLYNTSTVKHFGTATIRHFDRVTNVEQCILEIIQRLSTEVYVNHYTKQNIFDNCGFYSLKTYIRRRTY